MLGVVPGGIGAPSGMRAFPSAVQHLLSPFAALLLVALERFSEDADILAGLLAHLQEQPSKVGPETTLECVRRAIWGMMYTNDACIARRSPRGLDQMAAVFVEIFGTFDLTISESKTETM